MSGKLSALSLEEMEMAWWGVCYCDFPNAGSMGNETCGCIVCGKDPHYDDFTSKYKKENTMTPDLLTEKERDQANCPSPRCGSCDDCKKHYEARDEDTALTESQWASDEGVGIVLTPNEMEQYVECAGIGPVQLDCGCTPDWDEFCPYCADVSPANIG